MTEALKTIITPEMRALYEAQAAQWPAMKRAVSPNPSWFVAQVLSGSERVAADRLTDHGFGLYYPKIAELRPKSFKRMSRKQREAAQQGFVTMEPKVRPLMPGYMFVHFDIEADQWQGIFGFAGVRGLWLAGDCLPRRVPDAVVNAFMATEVDGVIPGKTPIKQLFALGDAVRVGWGPFAGFNGTVGALPSGYDGDTPVEELDESVTFKILVHIFGRATPVEMVFGQFEAI